MSGFFDWVTHWTRHIPSQCAVCHAWPAQRVCSSCVARFAQSTHRCKRCALKVPEAVDVCGDCLSNPPELDACVAAVSYDYPWAQAIKALKFHEDTGWAATLATLLRQAPEAAAAITQADRVLCVPLSEKRLSERGFNQAALIARALTPEKAYPHALLRLYDTEAQSGLSRCQRLHNLSNAFMVEPNLAPQLRGQRVVVVDDVMTTGATLNAVAAALRASGVEHITALVAARTERD